MSAISSPLFQHLDAIAATIDSTPQLQEKKQDTIQKVKKYILDGQKFTQWAAWIVGLDNQKAAIRALQEYGNLLEGISGNNTVVDPSFLFSDFEVRDRQAELSKAFIGILKEMANMHQDKIEVPDDYWAKKISLMKPYCRRIHEDYVRIRDAPPSSEYNGKEYTYY